MGKLFAGFGLAWLAFVIVGAVAWIQGIIMVFHASVVLGIVSLFVQVPYVLESVVYWFTGYDIALHIARALGLS
ncbi:MAG TPA: hypothetical protein V6C81_12235 [Planktothrix sp.]|jgi:hypothetical protein